MSGKPDKQEFRIEPSVQITKHPLEKLEKMMNDTKRLYRSDNDQMLAGVCAGLGEYINLDPTIVRLIFVVLFMTGSLGFWVYLVMWIVVPLESEVKENSGRVVVEGKRVDDIPAADPEPLDLDAKDVE